MTVAARTQRGPKERLRRPDAAWRSEGSDQSARKGAGAARRRRRLARPQQLFVTISGRLALIIWMAKDATSGAGRNERRWAARLGWLLFVASVLLFVSALVWYQILLALLPSMTRGWNAPARAWQSR